MSGSRRLRRPLNWPAHNTLPNALDDVLPVLTAAIVVNEFSRGRCALQQHAENSAYDHLVLLIGLCQCAGDGQSMPLCFLGSRPSLP